MKKNQPNFLIGGTAAGGTSFLSAILVQHPEIYLPRKMRPEPHFFYKSWEYKKGLQNYLDLWFSDVSENAIAIGERSSSYLFGGRNVAERVAKDFPDMKFIFTLRNPIERTWANYRYTVLQGLENLSFEDALEKENQRIKEQKGIWAEIQPHNYTGRGFYANQLEEYLNFFPRENICLVKSESLSSQTDIELKKIYNFLGLHKLRFSYERSPDHTSVNVIDPNLQMSLRTYFGDKFDLLIEASRKKLSMENLVDGDDLPIVERLVQNMSEKKFDMSKSSRNYLRELFKADIHRLKKIVDFDLSDWK